VSVVNLGKSSMMSTIHQVYYSFDSNQKMDRHEITPTSDILMLRRLDLNSVSLGEFNLDSLKLQPPNPAIRINHVM
jgi:hypothetical protein